MVFLNGNSRVFKTKWQFCSLIWVFLTLEQKGFSKSTILVILKCKQQGIQNWDFCSGVLVLVKCKRKGIIPKAKYLCHKLAGLQRCGKSCRLRWINYLRPDLKRGTFSQQEENLIVELHAVLGNRYFLFPKTEFCKKTLVFATQATSKHNSGHSQLHSCVRAMGPRVSNDSGDIFVGSCVLKVCKTVSRQTGVFVVLMGLNPLVASPDGLRLQPSYRGEPTMK